MWQKIVLTLIGVLVLVQMIASQRNVRQLRAELADVKNRLEEASTTTATDTASRPRETRVIERRTESVDPAIYNRLGALEDSIARLEDVSNHLMERGEVPLSGDKANELLSRMLDVTQSERDRLGALRLLRRNEQVDDTVVQHALNWLNTSTNANVRDDILEQLDGMTNAVLKQPLLQLAMSESDPNVREEAVDNLGNFIDDPQVEAQLWQLLNQDTDEDVRQEAARALMRAPLDDARVAQLEQKVQNAQGSLDERMTALRMLTRSGNQNPDLMASLAQEAFASEDPRVRQEFFGAFDGMDDPALKVPLVYGLQDPNPEVRERAADALSSFRSDPEVEEWLLYSAQNDDDPRVRREALRALEDSRRGRGGWR